MTNTIIDKKEILERDVEVLVNKADVLINNTIRKINYEIINMYWNLGKMVSEYKKDNNSKYGDAVVKRFGEELYAKYGAGFNSRNIHRAIKFYELYPILNARSKSKKVNVRDQSHEQKVTARSQSNQKIPTWRKFQNITWSHIRELLKFKDVSMINYYLNEVENKRLSHRDLITEIKSKSFERTIANQSEKPVKNSIEKTLKDPMILNIENKKRTEKQLEDEIFINIVNFMKEIGNNITFYNRQYKINYNGLLYKVDFVLYNKEHKNFILIDIKMNKVSRKDISQMQFYKDFFDKYIIEKTDSNTIGIILCETKDVRVETDKDIYQIKYLNEIPKEKELLKIINENKVILLKTEDLKLNK